MGMTAQRGRGLTMLALARVLLLLVSLSVAHAASKAPKDPRECEVCIAVLGEIDGKVTADQRKNVEDIEGVMQDYCDGAKGKEKTMCYYMGVGDKEMGTAGGVKREISSSFARGINAKRLCTRLKTKDAQMCELRFEKKIDVKNTDLKKLRVKELRKICDDEGISTKGLVEKDEYINKIKAHFGIKDDL